MEEEVKCPVCNGDGYTSEHNPDSMDWDGEHNCDNCPIQVQCENCKATGKLNPQQSN